MDVVGQIDFQDVNESLEIFKLYLQFRETDMLPVEQLIRESRKLNDYFILPMLHTNTKLILSNFVDWEYS